MVIVFAFKPHRRVEGKLRRLSGDALPAALLDEPIGAGASWVLRKRIARRFKQEAPVFEDWLTL
jgi:hypothetical protein